MAQMKFRAPITGVETWKYKTGASGGGFGTDAASQPSGAALTITDDNELALSGANDPVDRILDTVNVNTGQCRVFNPNVGEIEGIITNGTLTVGQPIVGYADAAANRGKAKTAELAFSGTPTVGELKTAVEIALASRWVVRSATAGKANIVPRG